MAQFCELEGASGSKVIVNLDQILSVEMDSVGNSHVQFSEGSNVVIKGRINLPGIK